MAKLHSEIRIKAVLNITGGTEGDPAKFSEGDIVYDMTSNKFKVLDNLGAWTDAVTGVSADLTATSVSTLQDIDFNSVVLDGANGEGKVLAWSQAENAFIPVDAAGGSGDAISLGDTAVTITDTGSDGNIEMKTDNVVRWNIGPQGHLIPATNNQFDIGSAELKVRDMYISDASLWIGDEHKVAIADGKMKFLKRRKDKVPSGVDTDLASIRTLLGNGDLEFEDMTLTDWKTVAEDASVPFETVYDKDNDLDWEQDETKVDSSFFGSGSSAVLKTFSVAVDNKVSSIWKGDGAQSGGNAFYIDGIPHPELRLKAGKYRFFQKHLSNAFDQTGAALGGAAHPLRFYTAEDKSGLLESGFPAKVVYWDGDSSVGGFGDYEAVFTTLGNDQVARDGFKAAGLYVELTVDSTMPAEFWYGCDNHGYMGMKIINESAPVSGGATTVSDLSDVDASDAANGEALVYNFAQSRFEPKAIMTASDAFASGRIAFDAESGSAQIIQLHPEFENKSGGRIVIDTQNLGANGGDKVQLNLSELYNPTVPRVNTMNFEIFSKGTQPFDVEVINPASGPATGQMTLLSDIQSDLSVNEDATSTISIGEGQMLIVYADQDQGWYYEIRSGL